MFQIIQGSSNYSHRLGPIDNDNAAMISRIRQVLVDLLLLGLLRSVTQPEQLSEERISYALCLLTDTLSNADSYESFVWIRGLLL